MQVPFKKKKKKNTLCFLKCLCKDNSSASIFLPSCRRAGWEHYPPPSHCPMFPWAGLALLCPEVPLGLWALVATLTFPFWSNTWKSLQVPFSTVSPLSGGRGGRAWKAEAGNEMWNFLEFPNPVQFRVCFSGGFIATIAMVKPGGAKLIYWQISMLCLLCVGFFCLFFPAGSKSICALLLLTAFSKEDFEIRRVFTSTYCTGIVQIVLYFAVSDVPRSLSPVFMQNTNIFPLWRYHRYLIGDVTSHALCWWDVWTTLTEIKVTNWGNWHTLTRRLWITLTVCFYWICHLKS